MYQTCMFEPYFKKKPMNYKEKPPCVCNFWCFFLIWQLFDHCVCYSNNEKPCSIWSCITGNSGNSAKFRQKIRIFLVRKIRTCLIMRNPCWQLSDLVVCCVCQLLDLTKHSIQMNCVIYDFFTMSYVVLHRSELIDTCNSLKWKLYRGVSPHT